MMQATRRRRKHTVRLLAEPHVEKAWAAASCIAAAHRKAWVSLDEVGDFLKKRQLDAAATDYAVNDPSTRYAIRPGLTTQPKGWDDHLIVSALTSATDRSLVGHQRREDGNYFRPIPRAEHVTWSVHNKDVPSNPRWFVQT